MHCQKGVSNAIICLLIHTLLFSLSPLPTEADRRREQRAAGWKEWWSCRSRGEVNIKEGLTGSGKTCWLLAGSSARAGVEKREAMQQ